MRETISFSGPDLDDVRPHLWTYFEAVRTRKPVTEDVVFGHHAALACHMANESYFRKSGVSSDETSKTIKTWASAGLLAGSLIPGDREGRVAVRTELRRVPGR